MSLEELIIVSAHDESACVVLGAVGRIAGPVLAYVDHVCSLTILNRKLELLLLLILIHWCRVHRVIAEGEGLRLGQLGGRAGVETVAYESTLLAKVLRCVLRRELRLSQCLLLLAQEAIISVRCWSWHGSINAWDNLKSLISRS